jgi:hypothetical protein
MVPQPPGRRPVPCCDHNDQYDRNGHYDDYDRSIPGADRHP